jgi:1,2-dihydroxy-3-keto-5-methylthiopentene dioxygenase
MRRGLRPASDAAGVRGSRGLDSAATVLQFRRCQPRHHPENAMAALTFRDSKRTVTDRAGVEKALKAAGVIYEVWGTERLPKSLSSRNLSQEEKDQLLKAFDSELQRLYKTRGYKTADVVTLYPDTPNLDVMLAKFDKNHIHTDDEVRFIVQGRGVFTLFPKGGEAIDAELHPGDFITVPANYKHYFKLCADRQITAIRVFTDPAGWVANYVD